MVHAEGPVGKRMGVGEGVASDVWGRKHMQ